MTRPARQRLGVRHALLDGELVAGDVVIADGHVAALGVQPPGRAGLAVAGFIDLQVNGYAGVDFLHADPADFAAAGVALAASGVTTVQPTLVSAPPAALEAAIRALGGARAEGRVPVRLLGAHLEGPFLSPRWPGAHAPEHLRSPDVALVDALNAAGSVARMTLAPELDGGLELVAGLVARGIGTSLGHTDADAAVVHRAVDAGATAITHIHNAHRRFAARDPGPAGVALVRPEVTVTAIVDGVHLAPETASACFAAAGERFCLVSDAMEAAGLADGDFRLGDRRVRVRDGVARVRDGTLAGGTGTIAGAIRALVAGGATVAGAVAAATVAPARLCRRGDLGRLAAGLPADVTVLDDRLDVVRVLMAGEERFAR